MTSPITSLERGDARPGQASLILVDSYRFSLGESYLLVKRIPACVCRLDCFPLVDFRRSHQVSSYLGAIVLRSHLRCQSQTLSFAVGSPVHHRRTHELQGRLPTDPNKINFESFQLFWDERLVNLVAMGKYFVKIVNLVILKMHSLLT